MGLQGQLNDVSSDSIPLLLLALIGTAFSHLRSLISPLLHSLGLLRSCQADAVLDDGLLAFLGSGLAGLIFAAEQRQLDRITLLSAWRSSYPEDCAVCLSGLREGDSVRSLPCRHVFHKQCMDGWVDRLNFTCPLCRSPMVPEERVRMTGRRVGADMVAWFSSFH